MNMLHLLSSIGGVLIVCALIGIVASGYVKSPPNVAFIISGFRKEPRVLIGRAGIKLPFLERKDVLLVKQISVDIKTNGYIPTQDFIGVDVDAVAKIRVKTDEEGIQVAMKNFLNMSESDIVSALTDSLQGNMREIIGTITLKDICNDRKKFGDEVQEKAQKDMNALGVEIISCNIQRVDDENNLINALGQDNMAQIQKDASIAKANADKEVAIAEAIEKKAEAMKQYGQAAMMEMIVNILPDIAKNVAEPLASIEKVSIIGGDGSGVSQVSNNVPVVMQQVFETVKETTGLDLKDIVMANSKTAKTDRNITVQTDLPLKEAITDKETNKNNDVVGTETKEETVQNKKDMSEKETVELIQKATDVIEKALEKKKR